MALSNPNPVSCLYEVNVMHQRLLPKKHGFNYKLFMFYLNIDALDTIEKQVSLLALNRFNLYSLYDSDYCKTGTSPVLKERVRHYLATHNIELGQGTVMLLTHLKVMGYAFNPVSFLFCFGAENTPLCVIAEVGNTFKEKKLFLVPPDANGNFDFRALENKFFYVSPFSSLTLKFDFKLQIPKAHIQIFVDVLQDEKPHGTVLVSSVKGDSILLNSKNLFLMTLKYPLVTAWVILLIHCHAVILWLKKVPFYRKEIHPELQINVIDPHHSLKKT